MKIMLTKLYAWYGRKTVWAVAGSVVVLLVAGLAFKFSGEAEEAAGEVLTVVEVASVAELGGASSVTLLGTVRSVSEANIETESAGRITSVQVALGDSIRAGTVIATLENASERAAVLQAEGAYEATLASASVSDISVAQAQTAVQSARDGAENALQGAYTTVNNTFFGVIDRFYANPTSPLTAPLLVDNNRQFLSSERVAFTTILPNWQSSLSQLQGSERIFVEIDASIGYTRRTMVLIDTFLSTLQKRKDDTFNLEPVLGLISTLNASRSALANTIASLEVAKSSLRSAEDSLAQAQLNSTNVDNSIANAQIKQALGSLRGAQANLAKTIVTSPIAGTVNSLNISVGDFVSSFTPVAKVANNNALEITVFVGNSDRDAITVGAPVVIDGKYPGVVTHIGAGIDTATQKTEVKIATETNELTNGNTVSVALSSITEQIDEQSPIFLPITAIKFSADTGAVLTVSDGEIIEKPITIGLVRGNQVEVVSGVTPQMEIVIDARGLTTGTKVEVTR